CPFDFDHYAELLGGARDGGYRWAHFDHEPEAGDLFLRHDVDLSLEAALAMAPPESGHRACATDFLMTEARFYNLRSHEGGGALDERHRLGHRVGLHAIPPRFVRDERFDPVLAWHNPDPEYVFEPVDGVVNVMQPPWFTQGRYRSDSNQHWREGCPHD